MAYLRPFSIYMMSCNLLHYNDVLLILGCPPFGRTEPFFITGRWHGASAGLLPYSVGSWG